MNEGKPKLLVVDDEPDNLHDMQRITMPLDVEVIGSCSGQEALQKLLRHDFFLILMDVQMPEMDGFETASLIMANHKTAHIPIIFITAVNREQRIEYQGYQLGAVDYLYKPVDPQVLNSKIIVFKDLWHRRIVLQQALDKLKKTQAQLVQSEKMVSLGMLTAGVAHEINNPVNFIHSSANGLGKAFKHIRNIFDQYAQIESETAEVQLERIKQFKQELDFDELLNDINELIENIVAGAKRASDIVKDLQAFSKPDEFSKNFVDLHDDIDSTLALLHYRYTDSIKIQKDYGNIPLILCYPGKLNQVFMNLLLNAVDAINDQGPHNGADVISIKTYTALKDEKKMVAIAISNTGPEIPEAVQAHLFEPFFTTKEAGVGTGLGLAISLGIVEEHEGTIEVHNNEGEGVTFIVYLPLTIEGY